jgi:chromosome segregation ATPase
MLASPTASISKELSEVEIKISHLAKERIRTTNQYYERIDALQQIMDSKIRDIDSEISEQQEKLLKLQQEFQEAVTKKTVIEHGLERCGF